MANAIKILVVVVSCVAVTLAQDEGCLSVDGECVDWRDQVCTAGYETGLCGGDSNRRCCMPCDAACEADEEEWAQGDGVCNAEGGACQDNSNYCPGTYSSGKCGGPNTRQCCTPFQFPDPEFRSLYVASAFNIDWPTAQGLSTAEQQRQLTVLLDTAQEMNMNVIMFQIRPAADALYSSTLEPWSKVLMGTQGVGPDPFYDPLSFVVEEAHNRGIEVHAWLNPYRGSMSNSYAELADNHICNTLREYCYVYDQYLWLDPGSPEVAERLIAVIEDIVTRYDVDGIHFDDYFYPYPISGWDFPDDALYSDYVASGGDLGLDDWRRDNVNNMVRNIYDAIHAVKNHVRFSISPFGIYRPGHADGMPPPIAGFDPYSDQYADTKLWLQSGWADYYSPQLYWEIEPPAQSYTTLLDWWLLPTTNPMQRHVYAANGVYKIVDNDWPVSEIIAQVMESRQSERRDALSLGNIQFSAKYFRDNTKGIRDEFVAINPELVQVPPMPWLDAKDFDREDQLKAQVSVLGRTLHVTLGSSVRKWSVFRLDEAAGRWRLLRTLPAAAASFEAEAEGTYAVRAVSHANVNGDEVVVIVQ